MAQYERELKGILQGDDDTLRRATKRCDEVEKAYYWQVTKCPFIVVRAAGSLGVDLIGVRSDITLLIEVKASSHPVIRFSGDPRLMEQANRLKEAGGKVGLAPLYAYRLKRCKGDPWRLFALPMDAELEGVQGLIYRRLPKVARTPQGNYVLRWHEGMPLNGFIAYLCQ